MKKTIAIILSFLMLVMVLQAVPTTLPVMQMIRREMHKPTTRVTPSLLGILMRQRIP